jgi:hypothetical protein
MRPHKQDLTLSERTPRVNVSELRHSNSSHKSRSSPEADHGGTGLDGDANSSGIHRIQLAGSVYNMSVVEEVRAPRVCLRGSRTRPARRCFASVPFASRLYYDLLRGHGRCVYEDVTSALLPHHVVPHTSSAGKLF